MGLFLGWPIHRARGAPEEAPGLGQRQAGLPASRGKVQMRPSAAPGAPGVHSRPARSPAPGTPRPDPELAEQGRRLLLARAPGAAHWSRAPRPALRAPQTPVPSAPLLPSLSPSPLLLLLLPLALPSSVSPSLSLLPPCSLSTFLLFPPRIPLSVLTTSRPISDSLLWQQPSRGLGSAPWPWASVSSSAHPPPAPLPAQRRAAWPRGKEGWFPRSGFFPPCWDSRCSAFPWTPTLVPVSGGGVGWVAERCEPLGCEGKRPTWDPKLF